MGCGVVHCCIGIRFETQRPLLLGFVPNDLHLPYATTRASIHERQIQVARFRRQLPHPLVVFVPIMLEPALVRILIVRVLGVGDIRPCGRVDRDHNRQVSHGDRPVVRRGRVVAFRFCVLRAVALVILVLYLVAFVANGYTSTGIGGYIRSGSQNRSGRREVGGMLETFRPRSSLVWGLVYPRQCVSSDWSVDLPVSQFGSFDLAMRVVSLDGSHGGGVSVEGGRGGEVARGCLRGGRVNVVRRHKVPHLVSES